MRSRVNYVGELGWELHVPMAQMPKVFDALMAAGQPHGIRLFGTYAMNSLRMEKAYRGWGAELTDEVDLVRGRHGAFHLASTRRNFIGRAATDTRKQQGRTHQARLSRGRCHRHATASATSLSIARDRLAGITTSGAYGHAVEKSLAFAYVDPQFVAPGTGFEILMLGERRKAHVLEGPAWDPLNERLRQSSSVRSQARRAQGG